MVVVGVHRGGYVLAPELVSSKHLLLASALTVAFVRVFFLFLLLFLLLLLLSPPLAAPGDINDC